MPERGSHRETMHERNGMDSSHRAIGLREEDNNHTTRATRRYRGVSDGRRGECFIYCVMPVTNECDNNIKNCLAAEWRKIYTTTVRHGNGIHIKLSH